MMYYPIKRIGREVPYNRLEEKAELQEALDGLDFIMAERQIRNARDTDPLHSNPEVLAAIMWQEYPVNK